MAESAATGTALDLIEAAIDLFGRHGYDGVSTRMLADAARTNVSSIRYHFGGKEELHLAALDHILAIFRPRLDAVRSLAAQARVLAADDPLRQARIMRDVVAAVLHAFLGAPELRRFLPVVLRELLLPGPHFRRIYEGGPRVLHETLTELVAWIDGAEPTDARIVVRTHAVVGALVLFHVGRPILLARLGEDDLEPEQLALIRQEVAGVVLGALGLPLEVLDEVLDEAPDEVPDEAP